MKFHWSVPGGESLALPANLRGGFNVRCWRNSLYSELLLIDKKFLTSKHDNYFNLSENIKRTPPSTTTTFAKKWKTDFRGLRVRKLPDMFPNCSKSHQTCFCKVSDTWTPTQLQLSTEIQHFPENPTDHGRRSDASSNPISTENHQKSYWNDRNQGRKMNLANKYCRNSLIWSY